jgi:hypothetical protein
MHRVKAAASIPLDTIREQIALTVAQVKAHSLPSTCVRLKIQDVVELGDETEAFRSKKSYIHSRILTWGKADLLGLAQRVIDEYQSEDLSDIVSEMTVHAEHRVSELVRRDVLKIVDQLPTLFGDLPVIESLSEIFGVTRIEGEQGTLPARDSLYSRIDKHYIRNESDWSHEKLLFECDVLQCSQARFFALLAKLLHPVARRDAEQGALASAFSTVLRRDGFFVRQAGMESGYAIYAVARVQAGVSGAMKNLIFASIGEKPELVFRDAVNNDVEIVKNADKVLVFDRALPSSGLLLWKNLREWYAELHGIQAAKDAQKLLFQRLREAVHQTHSAGELALFEGYYRRYGLKLGDKLPALIPQVYLHYDPYTRRQRGEEQVLARQRMDFLMLLDQGVRIVIEIDGRHHYAVEDPQLRSRYLASAQRYAEMATEDRRLRLAGYEVYRFGGHDFLDVDLDRRTIGPRAQQTVADFFDKLLTRHGVG